MMRSDRVCIFVSGWVCLLLYIPRDLSVRSFFVLRRFTTTCLSCPLFGRNWNCRPFLPSFLPSFVYSFLLPSLFFRCLYASFLFFFPFPLHSAVSMNLFSCLCSCRLLFSLSISQRVHPRHCLPSASSTTPRPLSESVSFFLSFFVVRKSIGTSASWAVTHPRQTSPQVTMTRAQTQTRRQTDRYAYSLSSNAQSRARRALRAALRAARLDIREGKELL
mmetsp:Transcript_26202/g.51440  ORF Transcript_26202/g.51440 Transcript_26202/m.51440 type:complete len:219 (+) Transcript_26202:1864-2520(+)